MTEILQDNPHSESDLLTTEERRSLQNLRFGILGFGSQGCAEATNLRRSKIGFSLGLRPGASWDKALSLGFSPVSPEACIEQSDVLLMNLPDQLQADFYSKFLSVGSGRSHAVRHLVFAHGFSTTFKKIPVESAGPAHVLVAPKGAASGLVELYGKSTALPAILAYEAAHNSSPTAQDKLWIEGLAIALGCHRQALIWANFKDEAICDLFAEQALLCGGVSSLLRKSYEVLVEGGYHPEAAYFETLFELKLIVDLIWRDGISGMRTRISPTARYGDLTRGDRVIDEHTKNQMREILKEIETGKFADEFLAKIESPEFKNQLRIQAEHPIEKMGEKLRQKMRSSLQ
jgi:ketol-acid reductoisomerase